MTRIALALLVLSSVGAAYAAEEEDYSISLKGATPLMVMVSLENIAGSCTGNLLSQPGISEASIKTDIEVRLREAGISVTQSKPIPKGVLTMVVSSCGEAVQMRLQLMEYVMPLRNPQQGMGVAITWESGRLGQAASVTLMRGEARDLATEFVNKWLADNVPDPPATPKSTGKL